MTTLTHITASGDLISAAAWELLLERWDAVRADLPVMDVSQVRARWPLVRPLQRDGLFSSRQRRRDVSPPDAPVNRGGNL